MLVAHANIDLEKCTFELIKEVRLPLISRFYSNCNYHVKCGRLDRVYSLGAGGDIIAAARLVPQECGHFLLRNLCVLPEKRNQGVASYLLRAALVTLSRENPQINCYCFALPHLQDFYLALGFKLFTPGQVPQDIAQMHQRNCARKRGWVLMGYIHTEGNQPHK